MDIKARLENVLHCYLNDEQVQYIKEYYKTFYENPESYQNDGLVDIIIDDANLIKVEPWSTTVNEEQKPINPWDAVEAADNIEIRKIFPNSDCHMQDEVASLAIGHVNHIPVYFRMLTDISEFEYIGWTASYQRISDLSYKLHNYPGAQILRIYRIGRTLPVGYYVAYAYKLEYIHELNDVHACGSDDWEYVGDYPMTDDCKPACKLYVPFSEMSNGGRIPVMWYNPLQNSQNACTSGTLDIFTDLREVNEQDVHDAYNGIKEEYESIDLESHNDSDRYVSLLMGRDGAYDMFTYNRNHLARNGAIAHGMAILPLLLAKEMRMMEPHHSSLYAILKEGTYGQIAYIALFDSDATEQIEQTEQGEQTNDEETYQSNKERDQYAGREYLDNHGSRVQQLLNQGTGDYKEANLNDR